MRYYSFDGSFLWASIDPWAGTAPTSWEVCLPDGTRIKTRANGTQRMIDTNGNSVLIFGTSTASQSTTVFRDELTGRDIHYVFDSATNRGTVEYQKAGGGWTSFEVQYGTTSVRGWTYLVDDQVCADLAEPADTELPVVTSIKLPQTELGVDRTFQFAYSSDGSQGVSYQWRAACGQSLQTVTSMTKGIGLLSQMTMPSGTVAKYSYNLDLDIGGPPTAPLDAVEFPGSTITRKDLIHDDRPASNPDRWTYAIATLSGGAAVSGPDGSTTVQTCYPHDPAFQQNFGGADGRGGLVYRTDYSNKVRVERHWRLNGFSGGVTAAGSAQLVPFNPVVDAEYTSMLDAGGTPAKMSAKTFQYDLNGNLTGETDYDWFAPNLVSRDPQGVPTGVPQGATVLRVLANSYYNAAGAASSPNLYANRVAGSPPSPLILSAPLERTISDAAAQLSRTQFLYDNSTATTVPTNGNLMQERRWLIDEARWVATSYGYDIYGNRTSMTDANGNVTTWAYDAQTHAKPTSVTVDPNPSVPGDELTTQTAYDFWTGLVTGQTDANQQATSTDYTNHLTGTIDPFGRPGVVTGPAVTVTVAGATSSQRRQAVSRYYDSARQVEVLADLNAQGDGKLRTRTSLDQLGRAVLSEASEDGSSYTVQQQTAYEQMGRITYTSNPRRGAAAATDGWTRVTKDDYGRVVEVATFDGATRPTATASNWNGRVQTGYSTIYMTVTDQAGKQRRSAVDGLGRLVRVDEPTAAGLGTETSPNQRTDYTYDALGNLTRVQQGGQTRQYVHDSLSRLKSARQPEQVNAQGQPVATTYSYYDNSNLRTKANPNGSSVSFTYDGLNRVKTKTLSTGGVWAYGYDSGTNGKGRLVSVVRQGGSDGSYYDGYDAMGRVTSSRQITDGRSYGFSNYGYDLAGSLTSETYPSGRVISTSYDAAGRLAQLSGQKSGEGVRTYASLYSYTAAGAVSAVQLGNQKWEHTVFNSRLQPVQIGLGTASTNSGLLELDYGYGTTNNNGNVQTQSIVVGATTFSQSYSYDELNRLRGATEAGGGCRRMTTTASAIGRCAAAPTSLTNR